MSLLRSLALLTVLIGLAAPRELPPPLPLEARLAAAAGGAYSGGLVDCWNALTELRSCTSEIVLFFLNGESYLTIGCCKAIRVITHSCWPAMLASLGFTAEEADILRGYCDAETAAGAAPPALPPAAA